MGTQTVRWDVRRGNWAVVLMNRDGSPGVATEVGIGAKLGILAWFGGGLVAIGVALGAAGALMIAFAGRTAVVIRDQPAASGP
ncbi:MAG TPA: hypothetical protein VJN72_03790 [Gaiellales bacterium]|nr:hypothetical protein [Gaiellales bacterium]